VSVPSVVNLPYDQALAELQGRGFAVARQDVDSDQPKDTVINQNPAGDTTAPPGSTVTLYVSKGPKTFEIPDVTQLERHAAAVTLRNAGFRIAVVIQDTTDDLEDGIVIAQDPTGGSQAPLNSVVTITVGHLVTPATTTVATTTEPTTTEPTTTAVTTAPPTTTTVPPPPPPPRSQ
jgi:serine/threonine-protein kinase